MRAVYSKNKRLLIVAGVGTGKTQTLMNRYVAVTDRDST